MVGVPSGEDEEEQRCHGGGKPPLRVEAEGGAGGENDDQRPHIAVMPALACGETVKWASREWTPTGAASGEQPEREQDKDDQDDEADDAQAGAQCQNLHA